MIDYQEPSHTIYCGHALDILKGMPDELVDMVITSPPYWGLRTYKTEPIIWGENHCEHDFGLEDTVRIRGSICPDPEWQREGRDNIGTHRSLGQFCPKCHAWKGELGLEPTIELYIEHLILIFNEVKRVLKKTGTCWVNLDDSYAAGGGKAVQQSHKRQAAIDSGSYPDNSPTAKLRGLMGKSLCLIPQRFAIAMVNSGWILRNDIVWNKPNPMPESVKDRFTGSWEHLFFFVKHKRYFFEQQFEAQQLCSLQRLQRTHRGYDPGYPGGVHSHMKEYFDRFNKSYSVEEIESIVGGRNKRDVWEIATEPYPEAHFATFPEKLCETPILAGCPLMICKKCGKAREKVYGDSEWESHQSEGMAALDTPDSPMYRGGHHNDGLPYRSSIKDKGYTDCGCHADFEPGVVLDPFCGSGKALVVAKKLGRKSIGIDLNPDYCKLSVKALQGIPLPMELGV